MDVHAGHLHQFSVNANDQDYAALMLLNFSNTKTLFLSDPKSVCACCCHFRVAMPSASSSSFSAVNKPKMSGNHIPFHASKITKKRSKMSVTSPSTPVKHREDISTRPVPIKTEKPKVTVTFNKCKTMSLKDSDDSEEDGTIHKYPVRNRTPYRGIHLWDDSIVRLLDAAKKRKKDSGDLYLGCEFCDKRFIDEGTFQSHMACEHH